MQKDLTEMKIFKKVLGGYFFSETPCICIYTVSTKKQNQRIFSI